MTARLTHYKKIIELLLEQEWVSSAELVPHVGWKFASRISELNNKHGYKIEGRWHPFIKRKYLYKLHYIPKDKREVREEPMFLLTRQEQMALI